MNDDIQIDADWLTKEFSLEVADSNSTEVKGWLVTELSKPGCGMTTIRVVDVGDCFMVEISQHDPDDDPNWPNGVAFHVPNRSQLLAIVSALEATA